MNMNNIKILLGTPIHSSFKPQFVSSLFKTTKEFSNHMSFYTEIGNNHIGDARNEIIDLFLDYEEFTHLLFIDGDEEWEIQDIYELLKYSSFEDPYVIAGVYPKQLPNFELLKNLSLNGIEDLYNYTGQFNPYSIQPKVKNPDLTKPVESYTCMSGFMLINKVTLQKIKNEFPDDYYRGRYKDKIHNFFEPQFTKNEGVIGQEIKFCRTLNTVGGKIFVLPWVSVTHIGDFEFKRKLV